MAAKKTATAADSRQADLVKKLQGKFGALAAIIPGLHDARSEVQGVIRGGVHVLDRFVLGAGGLPWGRMSEWFSEEGVGKTHAAWTFLGANARAGGLSIYCDAEDSFDADRAAKFGMDPNQVILLQPKTLEEGLDQTLYAVTHAEAKGPLLVAFDSIGGAQYDNEAKAKTINANVQDDRAHKLGKFCRTVLKLGSGKKVHLMMINQTRMKRGVIFGDNTTTPGGKAPKFHSSQRVQLFGGKSLKDALGLHVGKTITFMAVKNRFAPPYRKAKVRLDYEKGWDNLWATLNLAKDLALVDKGLKAVPESYTKAVEALAIRFPGMWDDVPREIEGAASTAAEEEEDLDEWAGEKPAAQD